MGLLKKLSATFTGTDRYTSRACTKEDFEACLAVRKDAYADLLSSWKNEGPCPVLESPLDALSEHILCTDTRTGEAVGYLRLSPAESLKSMQDPALTESLKHFPASVLPFVSVWGLLAVKGKDSASIRQSLLLGAYAQRLTSKNAALALCFCNPSQFNEYRRFGFRPLSKVVSSALSGYTLPLFLDMHAYQSLQILDSPFYALAEAAGLPSASIGGDWYRDFVYRNGSIDTGYRNYKLTEPASFHTALTSGLKDTAVKQLLNNALELRCNFGETVLAESAHDRSLGLVKKGALEVYAGKDLLAVLGEGDVFGELAFILGGTRNAQVRSAAEGTEILVFTQSVIDTLKSPADRLQIWKNLAALLAKRVLSANAALSDVRNPKKLTGMPSTARS